MPPAPTDCGDGCPGYDWEYTGVTDPTGSIREAVKVPCGHYWAEVALWDVTLMDGLVED